MYPYETTLGALSDEIDRLYDNHRSELNPFIDRLEDVLFATNPNDPDDTVVEIELTDGEVAWVISDEFRESLTLV
jgi:hypothetical protein